MPKLEIGPIGLLPPSAANMGIFQPIKGSGYDLLEGEHVPTEKAIESLATQLLTRRNPTLHPGPMIVWGWNEETKHKAALALELVKSVPGMNIITMPDYRPIYPKIDPEQVINPCHPNLTIMHNKIECAVFIGVHCHFANITLRMIRANTNCYTVAMCAYDGHEDALLSLRDLDGSKMEMVTAEVKRQLAEGLKPWGETTEGKEELADIKARKAASKAPAKDAAEIFSHELETGIDDNAG
tara:strand:- start:593 stop:1312 length:720 start_codon:yes stop_codon:yes gene_type:complete